MLIRILAFSSVVSVVASNLENSVFPPLPVAVQDSENAICKEHSDLYAQNLENFTLWAYEMWDATAKSPTGILRGSTFQMGHFEQCLTAPAPFPTQYCLTRIKANIPKPKQSRDPISLYHDPNEHVLEKLYPYEDVSQQARNTIQMGWCVPASCSPRDLENFLNSYVNELDLPFAQDNVTYSVQVSSQTCHTKKDNEMVAPADICFCVLTAILVALVLCTTVYDFNKVQDKDEKPVKKSFLYRFFMSFSARKNFNDLTKMDESNGAMSVLYGVRTLCIFCIILDHRFGTFTSSALLNFDFVEREYRSPFASFLFHGDLFVDSFFLLGGLLVTYGLLNQFDKKNMNPGFIILMRYISFFVFYIMVAFEYWANFTLPPSLSVSLLTPVYAYVVFYYATVFNYTGTGPLWKIIAGQDSQDCKDNWWANILYISNYVNADHMCMTHSWYLPCDFHYFIIAIGVCLLIKKEKKLGLFTVLLLTIISILIPFALTVIYLRPALLYFYPEFLTGPKSHPDFLLTYCKSHTRATPYFVGMFAGYLYYKVQGKNTHVCRVKSHLLAGVSIFLIIISIIGGAVFYNPYHKYNPFEAATYAALHRPAFAIGSAGIIYLASYGHASFIRNILSWSPWIPLSKLVYGAYLMHMQFQLRAAAKFMNPRQFSYFDIICLSLSDMVLAFAAALGLYLIVEAPFRKIFREILMPNRVSPPQDSTSDSTTRQNMVNGRTCDSRL